MKSIDQYYRDGKQLSFGCFLHNPETGSLGMIVGVDGDTMRAQVISLAAGKVKFEKTGIIVKLKKRSKLGIIDTDSCMVVTTKEATQLPGVISIST